MILKRLFVSSFCTAGQHKHHLKITDLVKRMTSAQETLIKQQQQIKQLQGKLKEKEELNKKRNNQVHQMRVRLTEDIKKAQQIWADAKKQIERNKSDATNNFAKGLIQLGDVLNKTSKSQTQQHSVQLKQGFQLTSRLFYHTLGKYQIKMTELKEADQAKKGEFQKAGQEKTEKAELKGKVAKVVEQGWTVEGKIVRLPKVIVYV